MPKKTMLDDLNPEEIIALVRLLSTVDDKTYMVMNPEGAWTFVENLPGVESLSDKINQAGDREDVKAYMEKHFGGIRFYANWCPFE